MCADPASALFDEHYGAPVVAADPPIEDLATEPLLEAVPTRAFALRGTVLTEERVIDDGYVVLGEERITDVTEAAPEGVFVLSTGGVILPGLIDLHGHPEYNIFAPWEPPQTYPNRYWWREKSPEYQALVKAPWSALKAASLTPTLTRFAEIRALVGGVTSIQGAAVSPRVLAEALVRNVDRRIFGTQVGRSAVDPLRLRGDELKSMQDGLADGSIKALYVHLAEGTDDASRDELKTLGDLGLLGEATVIIHGTALTDEQLATVKEARAKLVWSPHSNLRLYGATTRAKTVLDLEIPMGLGADWLPSGSLNTLDELRVARHQLRTQQAPDEPRALVGMVTWDAARIAALGEHIGDLKPGMAADVVVLERAGHDPWESVLRSDASAVELVLIGGNLLYGRSDWFTQLAPDAGTERLWAWGRWMTLDTTYAVHTQTSAPPKLQEIRTAILEHFQQLGPIFA